MIYNRGTVGSYQAWANAVNDSSWEFEQLLPYFADGTNYTTVNPNNTYRFANSSSIPPPANPDAVNASGAPLHISYPNYALGMSSWMQLSMRALGFPDQQDFLSGSLIGAQYAPVTVDPEGQVRSSSQESYLNAAFQSRRQNLKVYTHTLAKKVLFDTNKRATGVQVFSERGQAYTLSAKREIVLSAGAFQSPQLLMVSGIGPASELQKFNIPLLVNSSGVGQNMWDHLDFGPTYQINVEGLTAGYSEFNARASQEYVANRTGILTSPQVEYIGWEKLPAAYRANFTNSTRADLAQFPADWPEVEYEVSQAPLGAGSEQVAYGVVLAIPVSPLSRGTVTLASNDTKDLPIISPNWLTHPTDQQVAVQAFRRAREMFQTSVIQPLIVGQEVAPGLNVTSDADILEYIRNNSFMNWHAACTCESYEIGTRSKLTLLQVKWDRFLIQWQLLTRKHESSESADCVWLTLLPSLCYLPDIPKAPFVSSIGATSNDVHELTLADVVAEKIAADMISDARNSG